MAIFRQLTFYCVFSILAKYPEDVVDKVASLPLAAAKRRGWVCAGVHCGLEPQ